MCGSSSAGKVQATEGTQTTNNKIPAASSIGDKARNATEWEG